MQDHIAELAEVIQRAPDEAEARRALDTVIHAGNAAEHHYRRTRDFLLAQLAALDDQDKAVKEHYYQLRMKARDRIEDYQPAY